MSPLRMVWHFQLSIQIDHFPKSLANIYKELDESGMLNYKRTTSDLSDWAEQGVLLLNTQLTTIHGTSLAHKSFGWELLTDNILTALAKKERLVVILWGNMAKKKRSIFDDSKHLILEECSPKPAFGVSRIFRLSTLQIV